MKLTFKMNQIDNKKKYAHESKKIKIESTFCISLQKYHQFSQSGSSLKTNFIYNEK